MNDFKKQCIDLRKKDYSLLEIARITGRPKTSVFFHIQGMPLSNKKKASIRKASGEHIRKFAVARKGKSARPYKSFDVWTPQTVLLVGHLLFDGEIGRRKCAYNNRSEALISRVEKLMPIVYDWEPKRIYNKETGVMRLAYYNVALGNYLYKRSQELLKDISTMDTECKREFLRSFFDDEGCMDFNMRRRRVRGYQNDRKLLILIQTLLNDFAITAVIKEPNEVMVTGKENLIRFQKEINFSPGVRVNGKRKNSVWKKSLEKREILDMAIKSFKT